LGRSAYGLARRRLVDRLREDGIGDARVLDAFMRVPRHEWVPATLRTQAYKNTPLPIGEGQTISAPGVVASMTQALALTGDEKVLEIGTGSGFQTAILSRLCRHIDSIERIPELASTARAVLDRMEVRNVHCFVGDGTRGHPAGAPYDRVIVTAGGPEIPPRLLGQLAEGGVLVGPFGGREVQELVRMRRTGPNRFSREVLGLCQFVGLIGEDGWAA
jgi:protein-L-isoaspartate(D-aspartate) O-methyltransferase